MDQKQFSLWLSGFIDGEGNFQVFLDRTYLRTIFRIRLHIDDVTVLYKIKEFLGVGKVTIHGSNCLFSTFAFGYATQRQKLLIFVRCKMYYFLY